MTAAQLVTYGLLLVLALAAEAVGRHTRLPRISLLVLLGFLLGPAVFDVIDPREAPAYDFIAALALSMVGFLVGGKLHRSQFRRSGGLILRLSALQSAATFAVVWLGLSLLQAPPALALTLAAVATATDPAATLDAIRDADGDSRFSKVLTGVVALDDAWGLLLFSVAVVIIEMTVASGNAHAPLLAAGRELFGALVLGIAVGLPTALFSGRIRPGQPTLMEATGMVMICAGLAQWLHLPHLLACVVMGVTVTNMARHHKRPFHAVEEIEWPFLAIFFLFTGAWLTPAALGAAGGLLLAYLVLRLAGRAAGGAFSAVGAGADRRLSLWMGLAMLPQAGVAMAMTFQACTLYPGLRDSMLPTVIAATVVFELVGPLITRRVIGRVGAA